MNIQDSLEAIKKITNALTPLGVEVIAVNGLQAVEYATPGSEALRIPEATARYTTAEITVRVPFAEPPIGPENRDTSQERGSR